MAGDRLTVCEVSRVSRALVQISCIIMQLNPHRGVPPCRGGGAHDSEDPMDL